MADYLLTNDEDRIGRKMSFLDGWLREVGGKAVSEEALRVAVSVSPDYLRTALKVIEAAHGSVNAYLEDRLGVDAAMREQLHARLLA